MGEREKVGASLPPSKKPLFSLEGEEERGRGESGRRRRRMEERKEGKEEGLERRPSLPFLFTVLPSSGEEKVEERRNSPFYPLPTSTSFPLFSFRVRGGKLF